MADDEQHDDSGMNEAQIRMEEEKKKRMAKMEEEKASVEVDFLVVGGGIAGVTCAETLLTEEPEASVCLLSATPAVKAVTNLRQLTRVAEQFDVSEESLADYRRRFPNLRLLQSDCSGFDADRRLVFCSAVQAGIRYKELCICTGAVPKAALEPHPLLLTLRDTDSARLLSRRLAASRRVVIVGNGGIATELVWELGGVDVVWVVRDDSIGAAFFDAGAGEFLYRRLEDGKPSETNCAKYTKYTKYSVGGEAGGERQPMGAALGPDWSSGLRLLGGAGRKSVRVVRGAELLRLLSSPPSASSSSSSSSSSDVADWPAYASLSNGESIGCDLVISATGVRPSARPFDSDARLRLDADGDGGVLVDAGMRSSLPNVYAAGDAATLNGPPGCHWLQMRLWTQARRSGAAAAASMLASSRLEPPPQTDISFELFAHVTSFFGYKVVLLGLFNAQRLEPGSYELLLRVTPGVEFVKCVMQNGRMQGCVLIGDTDLEETFENLILNQLDLSHFGEHLLDPNVDIEDYFD